MCEGVLSVFKNVRESSAAKKLYGPVSLLYVKKFVNNRLVDRLKKCGLFSDLQYGFRLSRSTADPLTVPHRIAIAFHRPRTTWPVARNISKTFDRVWHAFLFYKLKPRGISGQIFGLSSSFLSNRRFQMVLPKNIQLMLEFLDPLFSVPHFSYYTLMTFLMMFYLILVYMLMILLSTQSVFRTWSVAITWTGFWTWIWSPRYCEILWTGAWSGLLICMMMEKLSWFWYRCYLCENGWVCSWRKMIFKMLRLIFSTKLNWVSYIISIAKTANKEIRPLNCSMKFFSPEVAQCLYNFTIRPCI